MERILYSRHYLIALDDDRCSCRYRPLLLLSFDTQTIFALYIYILILYCARIHLVKLRCARPSINQTHYTTLHYDGRRSRSVPTQPT